jgi:hypothetical protein
MEKKDMLLGVDGSMTPIAPSKGEEYSLREVQSWVGGYIEIVRLDDEWILVVNEDGLAMGLPFNARASMIVGGTIVGPAALVQSRRLK